MGNGMNRVLPGLYVGNFRDSKDAIQLDRYNITHILAIHDAARKIYPDKHYLCVMASDTPDQNLVQYFSVCNDFIHAARLRGGNVLIHCLAGMSRSVTVCVAYIMAITSLNWKEALKVVRVGRSVANPNLGFQRQLEEFELTRLSEERRRLKERFPSVQLVQRDEQECRLLLSSYEGLLLSKQVCEGNCAMGELCPTGICRSPTKSRDVGLRRKSSVGRATPPSSPRRLPATPNLGRSPSVSSAYSITARYCPKALEPDMSAVSYHTPKDYRSSYSYMQGISSGRSRALNDNFESVDKYRYFPKPLEPDMSMVSHYTPRDLPSTYSYRSGITNYGMKTLDGLYGLRDQYRTPVGRTRLGNSAPPSPSASRHDLHAPISAPSSPARRLTRTSTSSGIL